MNKKSVIITARDHTELKKLSTVFNSTIGSLVGAMINYFKRTGINPQNAISENPSLMVKALDKRIVSFLKVQERDILKPLRTEVYSYSKNQQEQIDGLTNSLKQLLTQMNTADKNRTIMVRAELEKQQNALIEIAIDLDPKNRNGLQEKIKAIFN